MCKFSCTFLCDQIEVSFHINIARARSKSLILICHRHKVSKIFVCVSTMARHYPTRVLVNLLIKFSTTPVAFHVFRMSFVPLVRFGVPVEMEVDIEELGLTPAFACDVTRYGLYVVRPIEKGLENMFM